jgi:hypothetical protein
MSALNANGEESLKRDRSTLRVVIGGALSVIVLCACGGLEARYEFLAAPGAGGARFDVPGMGKLLVRSVLILPVACLWIALMTIGRKILRSEKLMLMLVLGAFASLIASLTMIQLVVWLLLDCSAFPRIGLVYWRYWFGLWANYAVPQQFVGGLAGGILAAFARRSWFAVFWLFMISLLYLWIMSSLRDGGLSDPRGDTPPYLMKLAWAIPAAAFGLAFMAAMRDLLRRAGVSRALVAGPGICGKFENDVAVWNRGLRNLLLYCFVLLALLLLCAALPSVLGGRTMVTPGEMLGSVTPFAALHIGLLVVLALRALRRPPRVGS